jgi:hypothetical protein
MRSFIFDEYKEELNEDGVKFGILYTYRSLSEMFDAYTLSPKDENDICTVLKLEAIREISEEIQKEYQELEKEYNERQGLINV